MSAARVQKQKEPIIHLSRRTGIPLWKSMCIRAAAILLGFLICGAVAFFLIEKLRNNPEKITLFYSDFINGAFGSNRKLWKFLKDVAILLCISLALTPAFRMRFWNIGGEGQTLVGVLACIAVTFYLGGRIPEWLLMILMLLASLAAGAVWGLIPAACRAKWGTNETLFTLMMNYVATYLVGFFLEMWVPNGSGALPRQEHGKMPTIFNDYLLIVLIAVALTAAMYIYLNYTKHGYEISVVGESVRTARYVGMNDKKIIIRTIILSGALCGLAGYLIGAGLDRSITADSVGGKGFTAIMVSWLGKFNPITMVLTSGLIQLLNQGAAQISKDFDVSGALPDVIVGIILFFIIGSEFFINYKIHFRGRGNGAGREAVK